MSKTEYQKQYAKEKLKRVPLDLQLDEYERFKTYCNDHGKTVNGLIKELIRKEIKDTQ